MRRLLIEDIALALGHDLSTLDSITIRKISILIDWALTLKTFQENGSYTPFMEIIELADADYFNLRSGLIKAMQEDGFKALEQPSPNCEVMDNLFKRLCPYLGFPAECVDQIQTGFIGDYIRAFNQKGLVHTEKLSLGASAQESQALANLNQRLLNMLQFNGNTIEISTAPLVQWQVSEENAIDLAVFNTQVMMESAAFCNQFRKPLSLHGLHMLCSHLKDLLGNLSVGTQYIPKLKQIELHLMSAIANTNEPVASDLKLMLATLVTRAPFIRGWQTYDTLPMGRRIDRLIFMGPEDAADNEVIRTVNLMLQKHPQETIVVTYTSQDIAKVNQYNNQFDHKRFTLQTIGHGAVMTSSVINANLGAFRGQALYTGKQLAEVVNACANIDHLRLSCCFSGLMADEASLHSLAKKMSKENEVDSTFTLESNTDLHANQPFVANSAALVCWNYINKTGRPFKISVSPGIIEPDEMVGKMVWKPSVVSPAHAHIKEVRVQTRDWIRKASHTYNV